MTALQDDSVVIIVGSLTPLVFCYARVIAEKPILE